MERGIHEIQGEILRVLLLRESARFSEINTMKLPTDQLTFHLKQLQAGGIVEKLESGAYQLTPRGKEYANRFDIDSGPMKIERQPKLSVMIIGTRERGGKREYLIQTRLKQPFFGFRGFMTGKVKFGESVLETASRELMEETGLAADLTHRAIFHERIYGTDGELLEDKYFYIFVAANPRGELIESFEGGRNSWLSGPEVLGGDAFYDIADLIELSQRSSFSFAEKSYTVSRY